MNPKFETRTLTAPACWAPYLLNGDSSCLSDDDTDAAERFEYDLSAEGWHLTDADIANAYFARSCDALPHDFNGEIAVYTVLRVVPV